ncbi:hypothetical protein BKK56_08995 [Rodentibacter genomosp. 2]|uniref:glycosyltransferase family 8 protein n=1 Tax=Rodentibacter TaxID=1960084 RepID=UPI0009865394|nr:glycosyltransferase [Rodentibacter heylii]MCX2961913.1 hypothetical protein [Rodentibacter heylii]OOF54607.1 hypothetical protein BKK56_08995 [Rodentibacter genomosp. 2]QIA77729.1 hypothetical protein FEE42_10470 [Rodentibacter heylii]
MLSKDKLVNKYLDIKVGNLTKGNNIVFCSDLKYSRYVGVAIFSILENNQDDYYCFHVFITDITQKDIDKLKQLPFQNCNIRLYWLNDDAVRDFQIKEHFSSAMYYRVLIPYILYDEIDNFLYLDSDVLCVGNIKELFFHNLSDKVVGVVPDTVESDHIKNLYDLGFTKEGIYFNSGVMLINTRKWIEYNVTEDFFKLINQRDYIYPDQDVLNILLNKHILIISEKYNYQRWIKVSRSEFYKEANSVKIIHFIGPFKPWQIAGYNKIYNRYYKNSPWKKEKLEYTSSTLGLKKASKYLWQDGNIVKSIYYHIKYLVRKLKGIK